MEGRAASVGTNGRSPWWWFAAAVAVYAATRLVALDRFPIYFHADEAFGPLTAADLLRNGLRDAYGRWLPVYFEPAPNRWMPIGTVYAHLLSVALLGLDIAVTRATTAIVTIAGAAAVALALRDGFGVRRWWAGALVLGAMPAWFLHSRTGFEAAMMTAAFAVFLWCYLRYRRDGGRWWSCAAVAAGAATFYAYSNGQTVMAVLGALLLVADGRSHWARRRALVPAVVLGVVLLVPFARFRWAHPGAEMEHLRAVGAYLVDPARSPADKAIGFARRYAFGLHPRLWFVSHDADHAVAQAEDRWPAVRAALTLGSPLEIARHRYRGRGHLALWMLPLWLAGLVIAVRRWRDPPHRVVLLAVLAAPVGAATFDIGITRVLAMLVPFAILVTIGLDRALGGIERRLAASPRWAERAWWRRRAGALVSGAAFAALAAANVELLTTALRTAPRWYDDYGLYGMQWGASQLFDDLVPSLLAADPDVEVMLTSDWANAADRLPYFFLDADQVGRVRSRGVAELMLKEADLSGDLVWIVTDAELVRVRDSGKFDPPAIVRTIDWPDGRPGFHAVRLRYRPGIEGVFAAEREARRRLVEGQAVVDGETIAVRHSVADMGTPPDLFDGNPSSLLRGLEANPLILELAFPRPRPVSGIAAHFAHMPYTVTAELYAPGAAAAVRYVVTAPAPAEGDAHLDLDFDRGPEAVERLRLTIHHDGMGDEANIHVRELVLR